MVPLNTLLDRIFGKPEKTAKSVAKDRLRVVLMQDRASIPTPILEKMRKEILAVMLKYVEIDESALDFTVERADDAIALVANVPIRRVRPEAV